MQKTQNTAASSSDVSESCDDKIQEVNELGNISDAETKVEIQGGAKPARAPKHAASSKTKVHFK